MIITVKNYQRHANSTLEIGPGVTSLIGKSDHGKTSIVRAIGWFRFDRPLGNNFVRKGQNKVVVSIDDVSHVKDKSKNYYLLNEEPVETKKAQELCGLDSVNIQEQLDQPFLLKASPGEVARQLALLIDLEKPQVILKDLKSKGTKLSSSRTALISLKTNLEENLDQYAPLLRYKRALIVIESKLASIEKQYAAMATLAANIETATAALTRLDTIPETTAALDTANSLLKRVRKNEKQMIKVSQLQDAVGTAIEKENSRIPDFSEMHEKGKALLQKVVHQIHLIQCLGALQEFLGKLRNLRVLITKAEKGEALLINVQNLLETVNHSKAVDSAIDVAYATREKFKTLEMKEVQKEGELRKLRETIDVCPFCGREK